MSKWISTEKKFPAYDPKPDSFGTPVLVWPNKSLDGFDRPYAYYGCRQSDEPNFYLYGAVICDITHWMPLPEGPQ